MIFFQSFQVCLNIFLHITVMVSIVMKMPVKLLFGEVTCWILAVGFCCLGNKAVLGGMFMAIYRVICIKYPNIASNIQIQRQISNRLLILEWITMIVFVGFHLTGGTLTGTDPIVSFCKV